RFAAFTSAPARTSSCAVSRSSWWAAQWSAVAPSAWAALTSACCSTNRRIAALSLRCTASARRRSGAAAGSVMTGSSTSTKSLLGRPRGASALKGKKQWVTVRRLAGICLKSLRRCTALRSEFLNSSISQFCIHYSYRERFLEQFLDLALAVGEFVEMDSHLVQQ